MSFSGFSWPKKNWFRLPNEWTDITSQISSLAELKVVEYVLRHTWGFQEPDKSKRITTKEFMCGRRKKGGGTIDQGTGLSNKSVYLGLKSGVEHGFLLVEIDDSNKSNVKKYYRLKMEIDTNNVRSGDVESTEQVRTKLVPYIERHLDRNKRNTLSQPSGSDGQCSFPTSSDKRKGRRTPTPFDYKATSELYKVVSSHIKVNCTANNKQWANQFSLMRVVDKIPKKDIRAAIQWYKGNIGKEYMIEAFSAASFRKKYNNGQIPGAMQRKNGNGNNGSDDPRTERHRTVDRVLDYLDHDGTWDGDYENPPEQSDVDRALEALGKTKREITSVDCMS